MSKRFTFREDHFIVSYLGAVSAELMGNTGKGEVNRSPTAIRARAKKLRECGAWDAILRIEQAQKDYLACLGYDDLDQTLATLAR